MGSKEMRVKLMVGTLTKETRTLVMTGIVKKGSSHMKMSTRDNNGDKNDEEKCR